MEIRLERVNSSVYNVYWNNNALVGTFEIDCDGFYYFWSSDKNGSWTAHSLRVIADKLDEINKPLNDLIEIYFNNKTLHNL